MNKELLEAYLEILDRVHMLGDTVMMDDELKEDIAESFINTGYLKQTMLNKRPVVIYQDEKRTYYMFADSFKALSEKETAQIVPQ